MFDFAKHIAETKSVGQIENLMAIQMRYVENETDDCECCWSDARCDRAKQIQEDRWKLHQYALAYTMVSK